LYPQGALLVPGLASERTLEFGSLRESKGFQWADIFLRISHATTVRAYRRAVHF